MIIGALFPVILLVIVILVIRRFTSRDDHGPVTGNSVRRFFQFLLMYGLLVVSGVGFSGLLGRLLRADSLVVLDQTGLARNFSFVVVGVPLYALLAFWTRRKFIAEPVEAKSFGWTFYITASSVTALLFTFFAFREILTWAVDDVNYNGESIARVIVWGAIWGAHWWLDARVTPKTSTRYHHLIGSLIGLVAVFVGLSDLLSAGLGRVFHLGGDAIFMRGGDSIWLSAITLITGIPVWWLYWMRTYSKSSKDSLWFGYVLLAGVAGGLIVAVSCASTVLYQVLVWFIGEPASTEAAFHFQNASNFAGAAIVGFITWWYHHAVLDEERVAARTEVQRIYEYLIAGIGLAAASGGIGVLLTALVQELTSSTSLVGGSGSSNTLIAAGTLLIIGGPVWLIFWSRVQNATQKSPATEHASATRRIYLFLLFGVGGLAGVVALLVGVFFFFDDVFKGNFGIATFHRARFTISILLTAFAVAGYHWMIYRNERELGIPGQKGLQFVFLIGAKDIELNRAITHQTGARVQAWKRVNDTSSFGSTEEVLKILSAVESENVLLLADPDGVKVIPIDRD
ncbi:MAG TPA: DUF5671 domain-containing protein [Candidatus Paceibacterota bacterium]|nr:DUF5671 domain-containing protein [Candidatus Paceibacterota bacterium]